MAGTVDRTDSSSSDDELSVGSDGSRSVLHPVSINGVTPMSKRPVGHTEAVDSAARLVAEIGTLARFLTEDRERQHDREAAEQLQETNRQLAGQIDELREGLRVERERQRRLETRLEAMRLSNEVLQEEAAGFRRAAQPGLDEKQGGRRPWRRLRPE